MSGKINIAGIVRAHLATLRDHGQDRVSWIDVTVLFICPAIVAFVLFLSEAKPTSGLVGALINASAILVGLLLNLLVLMFDQRSKVSERIEKLKAQAATCPKGTPDFEGLSAKLQLRSSLISETVANISFTTVLCIVSLCSLLFYSAFDETSAIFLGRITYALNAFVWVNVVLTILMVMKRVFALFTSLS